MPSLCGLSPLALRTLAATYPDATVIDAPFDQGGVRDNLATIAQHVMLAATTPAGRCGVSFARVSRSFRNAALLVEIPEVAVFEGEYNGTGHLCNSPDPAVQDLVQDVNLIDKSPARITLSKLKWSLVPTARMDLVLHREKSIEDERTYHLEWSFSVSIYSLCSFLFKPPGWYPAAELRLEQLRAGLDPDGAERVTQPSKDELVVAFPDTFAGASGGLTPCHRYATPGAKLIRGQGAPMFHQVDYLKRLPEGAPVGTLPELVPGSQVYTDRAQGDGAWLGLSAHPTIQCEMGNATYENDERLWYFEDNDIHIELDASVLSSHVRGSPEWNHLMRKMGIFPDEGSDVVHLHWVFESDLRELGGFPLNDKDRLLKLLQPERQRIRAKEKAERRRREAEREATNGFVGPMALNAQGRPQRAAAAAARCSIAEAQAELALREDAHEDEDDLLPPRASASPAVPLGALAELMANRGAAELEEDSEDADSFIASDDESDDESDNESDDESDDEDDESVAPPPPPPPLFDERAVLANAQAVSAAAAAALDSLTMSKRKSTTTIAALADGSRPAKRTKKATQVRAPAGPSAFPRLGAKSAKEHVLTFFDPRGRGYVVAEPASPLMHLLPEGSIHYKRVKQRGDSCNRFVLPDGRSSDRPPNEILKMLEKEREEGKRAREEEEEDDALRPAGKRRVRNFV